MVVDDRRRRRRRQHGQYAQELGDRRRLHDQWCCVSAMTMIPVSFGVLRAYLVELA